MSKKKYLIFTLVLITLLVSLSIINLPHKQVTAKEVKWGYSGATGPDHWGELNLKDYQGNGDGQSPINITGAKDLDLPKLDLDYQDSKALVEDNGHTIEVEVKGGKDTLTIANKVYKLEQFHFHNPSENHIDGKTYPLEGHFVYKTDQGETTVVSVLYQYGKENKELKAVWDKMTNKVDKKIPLSDHLDLSAFYPASHDYYNFEGSLTTPPCTEGVNWIVFKEQKSISKAQVKKFSKTLGFKNARPIQPTNGREIKE